MRLALPLCLAALAVSVGADEPPPFERTIAIHPAKPPTPALSVRLLPSRAERVPGDAAVFYHRAIESLIEVRHREESQARHAGAKDMAGTPERVSGDWLKLSADKLPKEKIRKALGNRRGALEEGRLGTLRETCDWGYRYRNDGYFLTLDEIWEVRGLAVWLVLQARLDADEGRVDEAIRNVRTCLAVARDANRGGSYIQTVAAVGCANIALDAVEELVQKPRCPNLYWALAALPRPLIDMSDAIEGEAALLDQTFPYLKDLDGEAWSLEAARARGDEIADKLGSLFDDNREWPKSRSPLSRPAMDDLPAHAVHLLTIAKDYRRSRKVLRDAGLSAERIEAMPMVQAVALDSFRTYQVRNDGSAKWSYLPYALAAKCWSEAEARPWDPTSGFPFFKLISASHQVSTSIVWLERRFAVLMVVEAVRLYAAEHDGALPARLDDLTDVPAPPDPVTGKPFDYKLEDGRAFLSGPAPIGREQVSQSTIRYELRQAR